MSKHTPGPWIADSVNTQDDAVTAVWQDDGRSDYYLRTSQVCECFWDSGEDLELGENRPVNLAEAEANAKLIAAAPDLLEALQDLKALVRDGYQHNDIAMTRSLSSAQAAIDKATK
jgi:hypothetical protein